MAIKTTLSDDGSVINIILSGILGIDQMMKIQDGIAKVSAPLKVIRIDLKEVVQIDSSVFSSLMLIYFEKNSSTKLELTNCSRAMAHQFSLAGLDRLMTIGLDSSPGRDKPRESNTIKDIKNFR